MIPVAVLWGVVFLVLLALKFKREDQPYLAAGFVAHELAAVGLLWFYSVASGDMDGYEQSARIIARLLREDIAYWGPELLKLLAHRDSRLLLIGISDVPTSAAAHSWGGVAQLLSGGDSLPGACLVVAAFGFLSKALLYAVVRDVVPARRRNVAAFVTMLIPSVLFWTSGLIKEAYAMIGLGVLVFGLHRSFAQRRFYMIPLVVFGAAMTASVKPYILFPVIVGFAAWAFASRAEARVRPLYVIAAATVAVVGVVALGQLFPQFGVDKLGESIAAQRRASLTAGGGSLVGTEEEEVDESAVAQLAFLPLALINALFRPVLFEVRSAPQLGAALENTVLFLLFAMLIRRYKVRDIKRVLMRTPVVLAATVFAVTFAAAVGSSTKNLGTLSRYRVPLMPAYVGAVLILGQRLRDGTGDDASVEGAAPRAPSSNGALPSRRATRAKPLARPTRVPRPAHRLRPPARTR